MKGITGKVIAIVIALVIAAILLVLMITGAYKLVPFLSQLADGVTGMVKGSFCGFLPGVSKWLFGC